MRMLKKLLATAVVTASATALAVGPALADPINGSGKPVTPKETDVVGVGSDTIQFLLDQLSFDYNKSHKTGPKPVQLGRPRTRRPAHERQHLAEVWLREDRPAERFSAGIARSPPTPRPRTRSRSAPTSRAHPARAPPLIPSRGKGGIQFVALGKDAVSYSPRTPRRTRRTNLSNAQLNAIYSCSVTNWSAVGGKNAPIKAELPQIGSGTRAFFLTAIGLGTSGPGGAWKHAEENEGVNPVPQGPERHHRLSRSASTSPRCSTRPTAPTRRAPATQRAIRTRARTSSAVTPTVSMVLRNINGSKPTVGTGAKTPSTRTSRLKFVRTVFDVVRCRQDQQQHPACLEKFFAQSKRHEHRFSWVARARPLAPTSSTTDSCPPRSAVPAPDRRTCLSTSGRGGAGTTWRHPCRHNS